LKLELADVIQSTYTQKAREKYLKSWDWSGLIRHYEMLTLEQFV
jgi:hypothetical protein